MNNKILVIVDAQYDFIDGSLAVNGAQETMNNLCDFIKENGLMYDKIVLTADWHPISHCSFKANKGEWPTHCVQHSIGAAIYAPILSELDKLGSDYIVLTKGDNEDREEYSVFKNEESSNKLVKLCEALETKDIDFCGIALDYCVKNSILDAKRTLPHINMHLYKDFSPCIGNVEETLKDLENNGIHII